MLSKIFTKKTVPLTMLTLLFTCSTMHSMVREDLIDPRTSRFGREFAREAFVVIDTNNTTRWTDLITDHATLYGLQYVCLCMEEAGTIICTDDRKYSEVWHKANRLLYHARKELLHTHTLMFRAAMHRVQH